MKAAAGDVFTFYEIPVGPCFRTAQDAGLTIQELKGTKEETLDELRRLAYDMQDI
ncbi:MAG: hypothetical protein LBT16_12895 [Treponema sp.]|jgi:hypothetical protein|nr:hypothetical protein [Treponema sp.]